MLAKFETFQMAATFYRLATHLQLPSHLRDQLLRASSSVALNCAEGSGKASRRDRAKFFEIAYASCRECQSIIILAASENLEAVRLTDELGAMLFTLVRNNRAKG